MKTSAPGLASVGVAEHGSGAVLVSLGGHAELLDRRRIELIEPGLPSPLQSSRRVVGGRSLAEDARVAAAALAEAVALVERFRCAPAS